jgi:hypothetical protein
MCVFLPSRPLAFEVVKVSTFKMFLIELIIGTYNTSLECRLKGLRFTVVVLVSRGARRQRGVSVLVFDK